MKAFSFILAAWNKLLRRQTSTLCGTSI